MNTQLSNYFRSNSDHAWPTQMEIRSVLRDCGLALPIVPVVRTEPSHVEPRRSISPVPIGHPRRQAWLASYFGFGEPFGLVSIIERRKGRQ